MSKRLNRLNKWAEENPYVVYADRNESLTNEQAQMLLDGDFESFDDQIYDHTYDDCGYAFEFWSQGFAEEAGYSSYSTMPEWLQNFARDRFQIDTSDYIETLIRQFNAMVTATLIKRNGEPVTLPSGGDTKHLRYIQKHCGIMHGTTADFGLYDGTYLKALGTINLLDAYKTRTKPTQIFITPATPTIGHCAYNGSGSCNDDQYNGKPRWMKAKFQVDALTRYGVDSTFGLTEYWRKEIDYR
jgi:hypothetical protein